MSADSTATQLAAVATFVWREIRSSLKTQGLLDCVDEYRLASYASIVTSSLVLSLTQDSKLAEACLEQSLEEIATEATRWRLFGQRVKIDRRHWLATMHQLVRDSRQDWAAELFDDRGRIRALTLSRAASFVQNPGVVIDPAASSEVCLAMMHSLLNTAQQRIQTTLVTYRMNRPRQAIC